MKREVAEKLLEIWRRALLTLCEDTREDQVSEVTERLQAQVQMFSFYLGQVTSEQTLVYKGRQSFLEREHSDMSQDFSQDSRYQRELTVLTALQKKLNRVAAATVELPPLCLNEDVYLVQSAESESDEPKDLFWVYACDCADHKTVKIASFHEQVFLA